MCCNEPNPKKKKLHFGDSVYHTDNMFADLWKEEKAIYKYCMSEMMIESKMPSLWRENKKEMQVDFNYDKYDTMIEKFDQHIQECRNITNLKKRNAMISTYKLHKQRAQTHFKQAKRFLCYYYLINHKNAIVAVKKFKDKYFGLVYVRQEHEFLKQEHLILDDDWFTCQVVPGFKQQVDKATESGQHVKVDYFKHRSNNDQMVQIKFQRNRHNPMEGMFIELNAKDIEHKYTTIEAEKDFPENLLMEAQRKATISKRKYLSIPPGDTKKRATKVGKLTIKFKQPNNDICLPASLANALFYFGIEQEAHLLFALAWMNNARMTWGNIYQFIIKFCPHLESVIQKKISLDKFYEACNANQDYYSVNQGYIWL